MKKIIDRPIFIGLGAGLVAAFATSAVPLAAWLVNSTLDYWPEGYTLAAIPMLGSFAGRKKKGRLKRGLLLGAIWVGLISSLLWTRGEHANQAWYVFAFVLGLGCAVLAAFLINRKAAPATECKQYPENSDGAVCSDTAKIQVEPESQPVVYPIDLRDVTSKIGLTIFTSGLLVLLVLYCWARWGEPTFVIDAAAAVIVIGLSLCIYKIIAPRLRSLGSKITYFAFALGVPFPVVNHMLDVVARKIAPKAFSLLLSIGLVC